jgi:hypothetical protein
MHKMDTEFTGQWSSARNKRQCAFFCKAERLTLKERERGSWPDVSFWHKMDIPVALSDVRFWHLADIRALN